MPRDESECTRARPEFTANESRELRALFVGHQFVAHERRERHRRQHHVPVGRTSRCADPLEGLRARHGACANERPKVIEHARVLRGRQRSAMPGEARQQIGTVGRQVIAATAGIGDDERRTAGSEVQRPLAPGQQRACGSARAPASVARTHRDLPALLRGGRFLGRVPALPQRKTRAPVRAGECNGNFGNAVLVEERRERGGNRLASGRVERVEKVRHGRAAVAMLFEIPMHTVAKGLSAHPRLEHADDRCALLVRDRIECVEDVATHADWLADATGGCEPIRFDGFGPLMHALRATLVVGPPRIDHLFREPRRERLVEPDVVPPRRRHQVAEPLVRHLVRAETRGDVAERRRRGIGLQQDRRSIRDEPGVLHREAYGERDRNVVELGERIVDAEPALFEREELGKRMRSEGQRRCVAASRDQPHRRRPAAERSGADHIPRPDGECDEVRRQRLGLRETNDLVRLVDRSLGYNRRVRHRDHRTRDAQRELPRYLEARLVEARERLPRGHRLEMRHRVPRIAVLQREDAATRVAILWRPVGERHAVAACGQRRLEREAEKLVAIRGDAHARSGHVDTDFADGKSDRIEPEDRMRPIELDVDRRLSGDVGLAGRHGQLDVVAQRPSHRVESATRAAWHRRRHPHPPQRRRRTTSPRVRRRQRQPSAESSARNRGLSVRRDGRRDARDPARCQLLLHGVLPQARVESRKVDLVERLVLVEAREHVADFARGRVAMRLQTLRADLLHHALHRRVDRAERHVPRATGRARARYDARPRRPPSSCPIRSR